MDLNATLLGQMITFAIFVWFTMRFVWPMLEEALKARAVKIANGLDAAAKGHETLANAQQTIQKQLHAAREKADQLVAQANHEAQQLILDAKAQAQVESEQILAQAQARITQQREQAHAHLQNEIATLAIAGAEKILSRAINDSDHNQLFDRAIKDLG